MKKIEVVAAILYLEDKIFCVQRGESKLPYISKKFEFPGGKIEKGETQIEALKRELIEELSITPVIEDSFLTVFHKYPDFELTMHSFMCKAKSEDIKLNEHISFVWLSRKDLMQLDWAAADLPIVEKLMKNE